MKRESPSTVEALALCLGLGCLGHTGAAALAPVQDAQPRLLDSVREDRARAMALEEWAGLALSSCHRRDRAGCTGQPDRHASAGRFYDTTIIGRNNAHFFSELPLGLRHYAHLRRALALVEVPGSGGLASGVFIENCQTIALTRHTYSDEKRDESGVVTSVKTHSFIVIHPEALQTDPHIFRTYLSQGIELDKAHASYLSSDPDLPFYEPEHIHEEALVLTLNEPVSGCEYARIAPPHVIEAINDPDEPVPDQVFIGYHDTRYRDRSDEPLLADEIDRDYRLRPVVSESGAYLNTRIERRIESRWWVARAKEREMLEGLERYNTEHVGFFSHDTTGGSTNGVLGFVDKTGQLFVTGLVRGQTCKNRRVESASAILCPNTAILFTDDGLGGLVREHIEAQQ